MHKYTAPISSLVIIDDDEIYNKTLSRTIKRFDCKVYGALNATQALAIVEELKPDGAVLDLCIGKEYGINLIKPLLAIHPDLQIVVLTGYASLTTAVQAIKLGAWNYLSKPADAQAIFNALSQETEQNKGNETGVVTPPATTLKQSEWEHLQRALAENNGNITQTAHQLGMHRRTLQRKLKKKMPWSF